MNVKTFEKLKLMRRATRVLRYHTMPTRHPQSVGEHTFNLLAILDIVEPSASKNLWLAALLHDVPEAITGDTPATAKWGSPDLEKELKKFEFRIEQEFNIAPDITAEEAALLKYCDLMELVLFSIEEVDDGNKKMAVVAMNGLQAIHRRQLHSLTDGAYWLYEAVQSQFEKKYLPIDEETYHGWPQYNR